MSSKRSDKKSRQIIAQHRMESLFRFATIQSKQGHKDRALRYMQHVRNISMKNLTPIPKIWKHRMCKQCHQLLIPGDNCRVRIHRKKIIVFCMNCSSHDRIPLKKK